jgi:hypothetical protein
MVYSISNRGYLTRDYPQSLEMGRGKQLFIVILQHFTHVSACSTLIEEKSLGLCGLMRKAEVDRTHGKQKPS